MVLPSLVRYWCTGCSFALTSALVTFQAGPALFTGLRHTTHSAQLRMADGETQSGQNYVYAYCHGFLSGPSSRKGVHFKDVLSPSICLHLLDLNGEGGPAGITHSGALQALDDCWQQATADHSGTAVKLRLMGSSLGGYMIARYAQLHPERVDSLVMLCPGFDVKGRWPKSYGADGLQQWQQEEAREFAMGTQTVSIPWSFAEQALAQPPFPEYRCPAVILHGLQDETVPPDTTRNFLASSTTVSKSTLAVLVEDDHGFCKPDTLALTEKVVRGFWGLKGAPKGGDKAETAAPKDIEVERRYTVTDVPGLEARITAQGGKLVYEQIFTDEYWDFQGHAMTRQDTWLRRRAGQWELKLPVRRPSRQADTQHAYNEVYEEVADLPGVVEWLRSESHLTGEIDASKLETALQNAGATPYATYTTTRRKYRLGQFHVDCDQSDFGHGAGHAVVEIEAMVPEEAQVAEALEGIAALADELGFAAADRGPGKLAVYMMRFCHDHYRLLVSLRVLPDLAEDGAVLH